MEFHHGDHEFRIGEPKSKHGYRTISMTAEAYELLMRKYEQRKF